MRTEDLIERLGHESRVMQRLLSPEMRTAAWMVWCVIYMVAVALVMFAAIVTGGVRLTPLYLLQQAAALVTGITAARAAFASVIPGLPRPMWRMPTIAAIVWISLLSWQAVSDVQAYGTLGLTSQSDWPCVASIVIGGVMLGGPLLWMLRRGAPLTPRTTAFLAGLAALSLANIEACLTRPHAYAMTILLWHGGTIALTVGLCAALGRRWLHWPTLRA